MKKSLHLCHFLSSQPCCTIVNNFVLLACRVAHFCWSIPNISWNWPVWRWSEGEKVLYSWGFGFNIGGMASWALIDLIICIWESFGGCMLLSTLLRSTTSIHLDNVVKNGKAGYTDAMLVVPLWEIIFSTVAKTRRAQELWCILPIYHYVAVLFYCITFFLDYYD